VYRFVRENTFYLLVLVLLGSLNTTGQEPHSDMRAAALSQLLEEASRNNPEVLAAEHGWQATTPASKVAAALPDTQLMLQSFSVGSPRPGAGFSNSDFAYIGFGAAQEFPYPGKRKLRAEVAERETQSAHVQVDSLRRQVLERLKIIYFQLAYLQQALETLHHHDGVLTDLQQIAESRYRVGKGNQQEVLKAQLQHTRLMQEILMSRRDQALMEAELKRMLGRPQDSPDIVAEPLRLRDLPYSSSQLLKLAREQNPDVQMRAAMAEKAQAKAKLAQKEFRPDFNVQYMFQRTGSSFPAYYMATFGVNLPNRSRRRAELAQATEKRAQAKELMESEIQKQQAELQSQYAIAANSAEQLKTYREGLIPQSQATFQSAVAAYQANRENFDTLLSSYLDTLNLELDYQKELSNHESALARIESLTGATLP
jgi:outer membrane protein, heavy metal efflux system